ncbi:MAG: DUF354 domain-containing protein [candidate division KSB1 bacterium]|nr:DUF354 domain-containing protein [candidate division KSB1 bacterium]
MAEQSGRRSRFGLGSTGRRVLFDVGHPCEVHHYRWAAKIMEARGRQCLFVAREKDVLIDLLEAYRLPYVLLSRNRGGVLRKLLQVPLDLLRFHRILRRFRPQRVVSAVSLHAAWVSAWNRVMHIAFIDTEPRRLLDLFTLGFVDFKVTAFSYQRRLGRHHIRYHGNHELAYLHPQRFHPDHSVLQELGLQPGERYVLMRFVAWRALHDLGLPRMSDEERIRLVRVLAEKRRVFISAEDELPKELEPFRFPLPAHRLHDALAFADLYVGEGITTASEATVLGTPAVLVNPMRVGYCGEAARKGMLFYFDRPVDALWTLLDRLTALPSIRDRFSQAHRRLLQGTIDVSAFMAEVIENPITNACHGTAAAG